MAVKRTALTANVTCLEAIFASRIWTMLVQTHCKYKTAYNFRKRASPMKCVRSIAGECLAIKRSAHCHVGANEAAENFFGTAQIQRAIPLPDRSLASPTAFSADFVAVPQVLPKAVFGEQRRFQNARNARFYWSERRDLNPGPPVPQTGALTGLRYAPRPWRL